jgi:hypothetical protein
MSGPKAQPEQWKIETNDRNSKIVATVTSLATGSLVLPAFFLREFYAIPQGTAIVPSLNCWAYLGWSFLAFSIFLGLTYSWLSVKWVKFAWGQRTYLSERTLDCLMDWSFGLMLLFFLAGILSSVWFSLTFHITG